MFIKFLPTPYWQEIKSVLLWWKCDGNSYSGNVVFGLSINLHFFCTFWYFNHKYQNNVWFNSALLCVSWWSTWTVAMLQRTIKCQWFQGHRVHHQLSCNTSHMAFFSVNNCAWLNDLTWPQISMHNITTPMKYFVQLLFWFLFGKNVHFISKANHRISFKTRWLNQ